MVEVTGSSFVHSFPVHSVPVSVAQFFMNARFTPVCMSGCKQNYVYSIRLCQVMRRFRRIEMAFGLDRWYSWYHELKVSQQKGLAAIRRLMQQGLNWAYQVGNAESAFTAADLAVWPLVGCA